MLTKDLAKFRTRKGIVVPGLVDPSDAKFLGVAHQVTQCLVGLIGKPREVVEEALSFEESQVFSRCLRKIILDGCTFSAPQADSQEFRWQAMRTSEEVRASRPFGNYRDFQEVVAEMVDKSFEEIRERLYDDLPEHRELVSAPEFSPKDLIFRHNIEQLRYIIAQSTRVVIEVPVAERWEIRALLRKMRFFQLNGEVRLNGGHLRLILSGPVGVNHSPIMYGRRLASFFPYIPLLKRWMLEAEVRLARKTAKLTLSPDCRIKSHYSSWGGHVPEEFSAFARAFGSKKCGWDIMDEQHLVELGDGQTVVPDFTFRNSAGTEVHLELFHKWHAGQVEKRLMACEKGEAGNYILGIAQGVEHKKLRKSMMPDGREIAFVFKNVPRSDMVIQLLANFD